MPVKPGGELLAGVRKIAVLRANAVGDFLFSLPALEALRAAYPDAEIVLLARRWHQRFLAGRPSPVDRVMVVPPSRVNSDDGEEDPGEVERFFERARAERFDLAVQLHGGGLNSNPFMLRLGASFTVGLKTPDAVPLDRWVPYIYFQPEVLRYLEVVSLVGARPVTLRPQIEVTPRDLEEAARTVPENGRPVALLNPFAGDGRRRWPAEKFAQVGDALAGTGARVVIHGAAAERGVVDAVAAHMRREALPVTNGLSLGGLAGLLSRCRVVVSNDSGPLHLACAVGTPTVGIFWCGNLINAGPFTRRDHRPLISWRLECPECGQDCTKVWCGHRPSFVADVPVDEVAAAAQELLETTAGGG